MKWWESILLVKTWDSISWIAWILRGCLHDTGMTFIPVWLVISYRVYMCDFHTGMPIGGFIPVLVFRHYLGMVDENYACATRSSLPRDRFIPKRVAVPCLHDTGTSFRSGTKISSRYSNRDELIPVWVVPVWDFGSVSCKRIQSHKREPGWAHTGMKVIPVSCKHPLNSLAARHYVLYFWNCEMKTPSYFTYINHLYYAFLNKIETEIEINIKLTSF